MIIEITPVPDEGCNPIPMMINTDIIQSITKTSNNRSMIYTKINSIYFCEDTYNELKNKIMKGGKK